MHFPYREIFDANFLLVRRWLLSNSKARVNVPLLLIHRSHEVVSHGDWTSSGRAIRISRFCYSSTTRPGHDRKLSRKCLQHSDAFADLQAPLSPSLPSLWSLSHSVSTSHVGGLILIWSQTLFCSHRRGRSCALWVFPRELCARFSNLRFCHHVHVLEIREQVLIFAKFSRYCLIRLTVRVPVLVM